VKLGSLFSGFGGLDLAVERVFGATTAWVSDIEPGPCKVLAHRFPGVPNLGDITAVDWAQVEPVDIITGGSPCPDLSTAGRRLGMVEGTRSNLWVEMREAIAVLKPSFVVWENVRGAYSARAASAMESDPRLLGDHDPRQPALRALGRVLGDLADLGFDAEWRGIRAADVGAPHGRFRVFVLASHPSRVRHEWSRAPRDGWAGPAHGGGAPIDLLPTPTTRDHKGRNQRNDDTCLTGALLPTPRATDGTKGGPNQRGSSGDLMLPSAVMQLLPTPAAGNFNASEDPDQWEARRQRVAQTAKNGNGMGMPLGIAVQLLPTPDANLGNGGRQRSREALARGDHQTNLSDLPRLLPEASQWGKYAAAVARWEAIHGPAPAPTKPGRTGRPKLNPAFAEWMMGAPAGWITDTPGVTDNEALRMAGNGVVQQQAEAAMRLMLHRAG